MACAQMGDASFKGGAEGANLDAAQSYFGKSCERGFLPGCHGLGLVAREQKRFGDATRVLTDACKRGYGPACTAAGDLQRARNQKRPDVARALYAEACKRFDPEGCLQLARLEEAGEGGPADEEGAKQHYEIAIDHYRSVCQQGYGAACYRYAEFFANAWGTETNEYQVRRLMEKSCNLGHAPACTYNAAAR
jgi:TPR repeat protein